MIDHMAKRNVLQFVYWLKERNIPREYVVACFMKIIEIAYDDHIVQGETHAHPRI